MRLKDGARLFKRPVHEFRRAHLSGELKTLEFNGVLIIPPGEIERLRETFGEGGLSRDLQKAAEELGWPYEFMPRLAAATSGGTSTRLLSTSADTACSANINTLRAIST